MVYLKIITARLTFLMADIFVHTFTFFAGKNIQNQIMHEELMSSHPPYGFELLELLFYV